MLSRIKPQLYYLRKIFDEKDSFDYICDVSFDTFNHYNLYEEKKKDPRTSQHMAGSFHGTFLVKPTGQEKGA